MRKLLVEIGCFIAFLAVVFAGLEFLYKDYKSPVDYKIEGYKQSNDGITTLIIGNSHTEALLSPAFSGIAGKTYNVSMGGQDLFHMRILLEKCIEINPQLKNVILGLDYELYGYNFAREQQLWKDRHYYRSCGKMYDMSAANIIMAKSGFFLANRDLAYLFNGPSVPLNVFIPPVLTGNKEKQCIGRAREHSEYKYSTQLEKENEETLRQILILCKKNKLNLILLNTPKSECYIKHFNKSVVKRSKVLYNDIAAEYRFPYLDLFDSNVFTEYDFADFDHLNERGVKKVVEIINAKWPESSNNEK